jgi:hypothetical protein
MLHVMQGRACSLRDFKSLGQLVLYVRNLMPVRCGPVPQEVEGGAVFENKFDLLPQVGRRVAANGHVVHVSAVDASDVEAAPDGLCREARHVLDALEALFLNGRYEIAVFKQNGGYISMIGIDTENIHDLLSV